jgi:hypothetical protein
MSLKGSRGHGKGIQRLRRPIPHVFLALLIGTIAAAPQAQEVHFSFNPPSGTTFIQTLKATKLSLTDQGIGRNDVSELTARVTMSRTPTGWTVVAVPESFEMTRNDRKVDHPILSALSNVTVTYALDSNGQLLSVSGYREVLDKIRATLPPGAADRLGSFLDEDALLQKERTDWNGRIGDYIGQTAEVGESWTSESDFQLPTGDTIRFHTLTKIGAEEECDDHRCVRIEFSYSSRAEGLPGLMETIKDSLSLGSNAPISSEGDTTEVLTGGGYRLIDPKTMLVYSEEIWRTMKISTTEPGGGKTTMTVEERREYRFDYGE